MHNELISDSVSDWTFHNEYMYNSPNTLTKS